MHGLSISGFFVVMLILRKIEGFVGIHVTCYRFLNRCQIYDKDTEMKEMKEQLKELVGLLRQSETRRKEVEKELKVREQAVAAALATSASVR